MGYIMYTCTYMCTSAGVAHADLCGAAAAAAAAAPRPRPSGDSTIISLTMILKTKPLVSNLPRKGRCSREGWALTPFWCRLDQNALGSTSSGSGTSNSIFWRNSGEIPVKFSCPPGPPARVHAGRRAPPKPAGGRGPAVAVLAAAWAVGGGPVRRLFEDSTAPNFGKQHQHHVVFFSPDLLKCPFRYRYRLFLSFQRGSNLRRRTPQPPKNLSAVSF